MIKNDARVTVRGVPDRPGAAMTIFAKIAAKNIAMDMIVQNVADDGHADISFTVVRDDLPATLKAVEDARARNWAPGLHLRRRGVEDFDRRAWAWPRSPAWPSGCSAPWPSGASTSS